MDNQISSEEVLSIIAEELEKKLDGQHELQMVINNIRADYADDVDEQAAAILATLVAYGSTFTQEDFQGLLGEFKQEVEGLAGVRDVVYVGASEQDKRRVSLKGELPRTADNILTNEDIEELKEFVMLVFEGEEPSGPSDNPTPRKRDSPW